MECESCDAVQKKHDAVSLDGRRRWWKDREPIDDRGESVRMQGGDRQGLSRKGTARGWLSEEEMEALWPQFERVINFSSSQETGGLTDLNLRGLDHAISNKYYKLKQDKEFNKEGCTRRSRIVTCGTERMAC